MKIISALKNFVIKRFEKTIIINIPFSLVFLVITFFMCILVALVQQKHE